MSLLLLVCGMLGDGASAVSEDAPTFTVPRSGSVSREQGLEAWARIFEVASHPRCSNCHVGGSDKPMWSGPSYGTTRPHGMNVRAGRSRIGAESGLLCVTCHVNSTATERSNDIPHAAPHIAGNWQLAPAEAAWFGKTSNEICEQLRDPKRNGKRSFRDIASHLGHDRILHWGWAPGGGREPAPRTLQEHIDDVLLWGVGGMPCPGDGKE